MKTLSHATPMRLGRVLLAFVILAGLAGLKEQTLGATRLVPEQYPTIQAGIDAASATDTVSVETGIYRGAGNRDLDFHGKVLVMRSREGPELTIIDCEQVSRGLHLVRRENGSVVDGFSIINGSVGIDFGGALYLDAASITIKNCIFASCQSHDGGGAAFILGSTVTFENCRFIGNSEFSQGGGAVWYIGIGRWHSIVFRGCVFTGNRALYRGGALRLESGGNATFIDCTITDNTSGLTAGGIWPIDCPVVLERTICRDNCNDSDTGHEIFATTRVTVSCSDIDSLGIYAREFIQGDGVIDVDPLFCDPEGCVGATVGGDYRIRSDSPCLPNGNPCGVLIGALGIGCQAPLPTGACCLPSGSCIVLEAAQCADQHGTYMGDQTSCDSDPCQPTPVQITTWGQIKASFRDGTR